MENEKQIEADINSIRACYHKLKFLQEPVDRIVAVIAGLKDDLLHSDIKINYWKTRYKLLQNEVSRLRKFESEAEFNILWSNDEKSGWHITIYEKSNGAYGLHIGDYYCVLVSDDIEKARHFGVDKCVKRGEGRSPIAALKAALAE